MILKLATVYYLVTCTHAWLSPERCSQNKQTVSLTAIPKKAWLVPDINKIAITQHETLKEMYKNHQFLGIPIQGGSDSAYTPRPNFYVHGPYNCSFYTYKPRLLASVACSNAACKLSHTVSMVDTYTSSEGYNWGVKISSKASFFNIFEVGGEVSTGGTYSCTYNKGRITTDLVECSARPGIDGLLQLYTVKSDMICDFGRIEFELDLRDHKYAIELNPYDFSTHELEELRASAQIVIEPCKACFILDTNKISDSLFRNVLKKAPLYNPYTDLIWLDHNFVLAIMYYKKATTVQGYRRVIPFTNEEGDSVYQYACIMTPF